MYFQYVYGQAGNDACLPNAFFCIFARQANDDVRTRTYSTLVSSFDGFATTVEGVATFNARSCLVVGTFNAIFHNEKSMLVQLLQIVE